MRCMQGDEELDSWGKRGDKRSDVGERGKVGERVQGEKRENEAKTRE